MRRQFKRLGLALAVSVAGLCSTLIWYYAGLPKHRAEDGRDAIARLSESTDEVQRRETTRVIWESLSLNDDLFTGEAIRTSSHATAKIRLKSGVVLHLDPDSLVILDQNERGLALDFLEGNLFVQGAADAGAGNTTVTLKTGQGEVSLAQADVSLTKGSRGDVDLEVFRGSAELKRGGQTTALTQDKSATLSQSGVVDRGDRLKLTAPAAGETVLVNLAGGERLTLAWTKLAPGYRVAVAFGPTRTALTPAAGTWPGDAGQASVTLKPGKWFVRVTATAAGQPELSSLVTPFVLATRTAPSPLEPSPDQPILKTSPTQSVHFRWLNRHPFAQQMFELARDERFAQSVRRERLAGSVDQYDVPAEIGTFYWRVTGYADAKARGLSSPAQKLRVTAALDEGATLEHPADHARVGVADVQSRGLTFRWRTPNAKAQTLAVRNARGEVVFTAETATGSAHAGELPPGTYRWTVGDAPPFELTVFETARMAWADQNQTTEYVEQTPALHVAWQAVPSAAHYRYRIAAEGHALAEAPWETVPRTEARATVAADGAYQIDVEAITKDGATLAAAPTRTVTVRRRPVLNAPAWLANTGTLTSDARGNVALGWNAVEGARGYVLSVTDERGRVVRKTFGRGPASLDHLRPGQYQLKVRGVDEFNREGTESAVKTLEVPNASDIRAPKIRAMKVR